MSGDTELRTKISNIIDLQMATCLIVCGELMFGLHKSDQFAENMRKIESFYEDIPIYGIDFETTDMYGRLKATIIERFGPKDKVKRRNTKIESLIAELLDNIDVEVK